MGAPLSDEWPAQNLLGVLARQAQASADMEPFGVWVMIERASATVVGDIGFHGPPDQTGTIELGYAVTPSRRRRGYAAEAARALVGWACAQPSVKSIVAGCDPGNLPSIRTLEKAGFQPDGQTESELRWRFGGEPRR